MEDSSGTKEWPTVEIPSSPETVSEEYSELRQKFIGITPGEVSHALNADPGVWRLSRNELDMLLEEFLGAPEPEPQPSYSRFEEIYNQLDRRDDLTGDRKFAKAVQLAEEEGAAHPRPGQIW